MHSLSCLHHFLKSEGFPGGSVVKNPPDNAEDMVPLLGWEVPLEKGSATHSSILGLP